MMGVTTETGVCRRAVSDCTNSSEIGKSKTKRDESRNGERG